MAKKKNYVPKTKDDWNVEEAKEHRKVIEEKSKAIAEKYKKWWDTDKRKWREGFSGH